MDERACNGDTLHLATGELVGMTIAEALEFHPGKPFPGRFARVVFSGEEQWQFDVFKNRQRVQQLKRLKNEANSLAPQLGQAVVFQGRRRDSVQKHLTRRRKIHGSGKIEQRGLSAAAAPYQRHKLAALYVQRKTFERMHWLAIRQIIFRNVFERKYGHGDCCASSDFCKFGRRPQLA